MKRRNREARGGFTLIELIVVITIIGILASVVVVNYPRYVERARVRAAQADVKNFEKISNMFRMDFRRFPDSLDELVRPPERDLDGFEVEAYLDELKDDPWGEPYDYRIEDGRKVVITSGGPDRNLDTPEDNISSAGRAGTEEEY